ncbi:TPA: hypothetical protein DEP58_03470 [Patescibacteria group bacterium]|nr:MAG: hypothetical protein UU98_C0013G0038 [Parcubacteria group bacterium GW2011_GWD2_42_14]HCC05339.1 hypothetical protein [Patescibacteria group bacterium]
MAIDENKIIQEIERLEVRSERDYDFFLREYQQRKKQQKLIFATASLLVYMIFILIFFVSFRSNPSFLFWPFKINTPSSDISILERQVDLLSKKVDELNNSTTTPVRGETTQNLSIRLNTLEETISLNPDKALTAVLLREKQKNLEENFNNLRDAQSRLDSKVDNFVITVLIAPVVAALLGLLIWFLQSRFWKKKD